MSQRRLEDIAESPAVPPSSCVGDPDHAHSSWFGSRSFPEVPGGWMVPKPIPQTTKPLAKPFSFSKPPQDSPPQVWCLPYAGWD